MKLLIVGLDGADFYACKEHSMLAEKAVFARLESLEYPSTPPCWFTAITGTMPNEHRIEGFRMQAMKDLRQPPFWKFLDCPIGIVNIPLVYHDGEPFRGFIVPGFHAPRRFYPPRLRLKGYEIEAGLVTAGRLTWASDVQKISPKEVRKRQTAFLTKQRVVEEKRVRAVEGLLKRFRVDVLFVGVVLLDRIGHGFAHHRWTMQDAYKTADSLIERYMKIAKPETVIVFSDHGMDVVDSERIPQVVLDGEKKRYEKSRSKVTLKGLHTRDGIFAAWGGNVLKSEIKPTLTDVAPTILVAMGKDVPDPMTGEALDIFYEDPRTVKMLEGLGYL